MRALTVNETKVSSRNTFIDNIFALESETESRNNEKTVFRDYPRLLDLAVNPSTTNAEYVVCWTFLVLAIFWQLPVSFKMQDKVH